MRKINYLFFILLISGCSNNNLKETMQSDSIAQPNKEIYLNEIKKLESQLSSTETLNDTLATKVVKAYTDYAYTFVQDSLSPDFLFKAAEVAMGLKAYDKALIYYKSISDKYPSFRLKTESLFLQGYLYDNFLNDDVKAKQIYEQVIDKYPNDKLAEDSKAAITNLGKTDEDLIKEFQAKNKK